MGRVGVGYQIFADLYAKLYYEYYFAEVRDGTTAFFPPKAFLL